MLNSLASLSRREVETLTLLARFRFLTRSHLQAFLFVNPEGSAQSHRVMTGRILNSLHRKQLVERTPRSVGGPAGGSGTFAYYLTRAGIRCLDHRGYESLPRRVPPRGTFLLRHALATAEVAIAFEQSARDNAGHALLSFECDWEAAERAGRLTLVPDAKLVYLTDNYELHAFVEVDLGTAGTKFFAHKIARYLAIYRSQAWRSSHAVWPTVLVVTPTERRTRLLRSATETALAAQPDRVRLERETEFAFAALPAVKRLGPLAPVWHVAGKADPRNLTEGGPLE